MWRHVFLFVVVAVMSGCIFDHSEPSYCFNDVQCNLEGRRGWRCVFDGDSGTYCAQPEESCSSKLRWSNYGLATLAGKCVDPALLSVDMARD